MWEGLDYVSEFNNFMSLHLEQEIPVIPLSPIPWTDHVFGDDEARLKRATTTKLLNETYSLLVMGN